MQMMKSTSPLHCIPSLCLPGKAIAAAARVGFLQRRAPSSPPCSPPISANGFLQGDSILALCPSNQLDRNKRVPLLHIIAAAKKQKPAPKPTSRNAIIASVVVPILLALSAFGAGKIVLAKIKQDAMDEAIELERRFNPRRLLTDGKSEEERNMEKDDAAESVTVPSARNRPKREE